jgi:hypothetical protein
LETALAARNKIAAFQAESSLSPPTQLAHSEVVGGGGGDVDVRSTEHTPRGSLVPVSPEKSRAAVLSRARNLSRSAIVAIVLFQACVRRFCSTRKLYNGKLRELARKNKVLISMPGTKQGSSGWYISPDSFVYYFVNRHNEWFAAAGPLDVKQYYRLIDTHVRVVKARQEAPKLEVKKTGRASVVKASVLSATPSAALKRTSTMGDALLKCGFELNIERADLTGEVFLDKKSKNLYLAVSVERLVNHSQIENARR